MNPAHVSPSSVMLRKFMRSIWLLIAYNYKRKEVQDDSSPVTLADSVDLA